MTLKHPRLFVLAICCATAIVVQAAEPSAESNTALADIKLNAPASELKQSDVEAFRQDDLGLHVVTLPDGSQMVDLQGRFQMAATASTGADGHIHQQCLTEHEINEHGVPAPVEVAKPDER